MGPRRCEALSSQYAHARRSYASVVFLARWWRRCRGPTTRAGYEGCKTYGIQPLSGRPCHLPVICGHGYGYGFLMDMDMTWLVYGYDMDVDMIWIYDGYDLDMKWI